MVKTNLIVAAVQMVSSVNVETNLASASLLIQQAVDRGARLIVLPEYFCIMGQHDTDKLHIRETLGSGPLQGFLSAQAQQHGIWLVGGTLPLETASNNRIYNTCLVFGPDGQRYARYDKIHLFGFDNGRDFFSEATTIQAGDNRPQTFMAPIGPVGLSVCYDLRFPELYRAMGELSLIVVPSAFTYTTGQAHWDVLLRARAIENQCYVLAAAQGGKHDNGRRTWGHSVLIDPWGQVIDQLDAGPGLVVGTVDLDRVHQVRTSLPALTHRTL